MKPAVRLDWDLTNASLEFKKEMCQAVAKYMQYMNVQMHWIRELCPREFPNVRARHALKAKTIALINMDHAQINATQTWKITRTLARKNFQQAIAIKPQDKSAWFGGEYDERTYY